MATGPAFGAPVSEGPAFGVRVPEAPAFGVRVPEGQPQPGPRRSRARRPLAAIGISLGAIVVLAGAFFGWSVLAETQLRGADDRLVAAVDEHDSAERAFDARMRSVSTLLARVRTVVAAPQFAADASPEAEPFRAAVTALEAAGQTTVPGPPPATDSVEVAAAIGTTSVSVDGGYRLPWDVQAAAAEADDLARQTRAVTALLEDSAESAATSEKTAEDTEGAYFAARADQAEQTIAANPLSTKSSQVVLTRQIEIAEDSTASASRDGAFVSAFAAAEQAVRDSQVQLAAEQDDPSLATRHEIEAYARSISNGITLDFVWAPEVSGLGEGWLSGTAQTWDSDGGWAIISLNFPVEEEWGSDTNPQAVVTHEVGHTQVYRENCWPLFSGPVFSEDHEMWATAWAISQGFDVPGSGIEAYGRPTDEQIEVAGQCR